MICTKCSAQLKDNDKFCTACGQLNIAPVQTPTNPITPVSQTAPTPVIDPVFTNSATVQQPQVQPIPTQAQPTTATPAYAFPTNTPQTKSSKMPLIIAAVAVLALIVVAFTVVPGLLSKTEKTPEAVKVAVTGVKVKVDDFTLTIPEEYVFDATSSTIIIGNSDETWTSRTTIESGSYNRAVENKAKLKASLVKSGYEVSDPIEKTIEGSKLLTVEVTTDSSNSLIAFKSGSSSKVFCIEIITEDDTFDYKVLEELVKILNTAVYEAKTVTTNLDASTLDIETLLIDTLK